MIPCYELRIGNYVLAGNAMQRVCMVGTTFSSASASFTEMGTDPEVTKQHTLESLQPIAMNDSILQQCNFVYHDYFKFWQLISGQDEHRSEMDIDGDYNIIDYMRKPIVKRVASLHQLQNIYFMLKGKELIVREAV